MTLGVEPPTIFTDASGRSHWTTESFNFWLPILTISVSTVLAIFFASLIRLPQHFLSFLLISVCHCTFRGRFVWHILCNPTTECLLIHLTYWIDKFYLHSQHWMCFNSITLHQSLTNVHDNNCSLSWENLAHYYCVINVYYFTNFCYMVLSNIYGSGEENLSFYLMPISSK